MRRLVSLALVAACAVAGAACAASPTQPSETIAFVAQLSPANEVPAVANAEASGNGSVTIRLTVTRDSAGSISAATAAFEISLFNFPAATALTMAHIRTGNVGANGAIVVNSGLIGGEIMLGNGTGSFTKSAVAVPATIAQDIINSPASFYFNVHSVLNPNGMARGQLVRQ